MSGTIPNQFKNEDQVKAEEEEDETEDDDEDDDDFDEDNKDDDGGGSSRTSKSVASIPGSNNNNGSGNGSTSTCVQVALRVRPLLPREQIANARECITVAENEPQVWIAGANAFTYDHVFRTDVTQDHIFNTVAKPLVDGILEGYNATILAYGQTGSGKTYTMGTGFDPSILITTVDSVTSNQGILPRCIMYLFELIQAQRTTRNPPPDFSVTVQFTELYNEEVIDLLARPLSASSGGGRNSHVKIHEQANGQIYLVNITTKGVRNAAEMLDTLKNGALNRTTASTNMNDSSSRSHAIFSIMVSQNRVVRGDGESGGGPQDIETLHGKFHFVDLAGSERLKRTLATGERAREGIAINSGLLALGNVISALGDRSKKCSHVPYRDSKLTRLLQDSLGGNSRTLMIACVSPNELDFVETLNTMKYANRAKNIKNRVVMNQDKSSRTISLLKEEIAALRNELMEYKRRGESGGGGGGEFGGDVTAENIMLLAEVETLKSKVKSKQEMVDKLTSQVARLQAASIVGSSAVNDGSGGGGGEGICDLTDMVAKYLKEIEELRGKLYESESECEKLRAKQRVILKNLSSPGRDSTGGNNSVMGIVQDDVNELLKSARSEVELERKNVTSASAGKKSSSKKIEENEGDVEGEESEDDGSDEEDEEEDESDDNGEEEVERNERNYTELANLTVEINTKQRLIEELENSQLRLESLKVKYEEKLSQLSAKIKNTEEERDAFMRGVAGKGGPGAGGRKMVEMNLEKKSEYESKIANLQLELKKWGSAKREHAKLLRNQSQYEAQIGRLRGEVEEMKRVKVKLMNQVRNENVRFREVEKIRMREIAALRKESRKNEVRVKKLEGEGRMKDAVLKRKLQEVEMLKKMRNNKAGGVGRKGSIGGSGNSPVKGKQAWGRMQANMLRDVNSRCNVASLERDMVGLIDRRSELRRLLEEEKDVDRIDSIESNLRLVEDKIRGVQEEIVCANEIGSGGDAGGDTGVGNSSTTGTRIPVGRGGRKKGYAASSNRNDDGRVKGKNERWGDLFMEADFSYLVDKLYEGCVSGMSDVTMLEGRVRETEEVNRQLQSELETLRDLLHHMVQKSGSNGIIEDNNVMSSRNSLMVRSMDNNKLSSLLMPPPATVSSSNNNVQPTSIKARRRLTSTTQELLGSAENIIGDEEFGGGGNGGRGGGDLNRTFTRNTRLTQSLRGNSVGGGAGSGGVGRSGKVPLLRQDTYCVSSGEGGMGRGGNNIGEAMNRTFLMSGDGGGDNDDVGSTTNTNNSEHHAKTQQPQNRHEMLSDQTNPFINNGTKMVLQRSVSEIVESGGGGSSREGRAGGSARGDASGRYGGGGGTNTKSPRSNSWLQLQGTLDGHTKPVLCLTSTDTKLVSGSKDGSCRVWDLETKREVACFDGHPHNVGCVTYLEDMGMVMTGSSYQLRAFDLRSGQLVKILGSSGGAISASALSQYQPPPIPSLPQSTPLPRINDLPHGEKQITFIQRVRNYFFTSMGDRIKIWDLRKLTSIGLLAGKHNSSVMCCTGCQDGVRGNDWIITGSKDHSVRVYEYESGTPADRIGKTKNLSPVHYDGVECLYLSGGDDGVLFSGSRDTCIKKWNLRDYTMMSTVTNAHGGWITGICGIPVETSGGGDFIVSSSKDGCLKMWDCRGKEFREVCRFEGGGGSIECVDSNRRMLFFNYGVTGGGGISNNNNSTTATSTSESNPIGIYKLSDSFSKNFVLSSSATGTNISYFPSTVNAGSRGGSGGNSNSNINTSARTQYLNDPI